MPGTLGWVFGAGLTILFQYTLFCEMVYWNWAAIKMLTDSSVPALLACEQAASIQ